MPQKSNIELSLMVILVVFFSMGGISSAEESVFVHPTHHFELSLPEGWEAMDTPDGLSLTRGSAEMTVEVLPKPVKDPTAWLKNLAQTNENIEILEQQGPIPLKSPLPGAELTLRYRWETTSATSQAVLLNGPKRAYLIYIDQPDAKQLPATNKAMTTLLNTFKPDSPRPVTPLPLRLPLQYITSDALRVRMASPLIWPIKQVATDHVFWTLPSAQSRIDLTFTERIKPEALLAAWEKQLVGDSRPFSKKTAHKTFTSSDRTILQANLIGPALGGRVLIIPLDNQRLATFSLICPKALLSRYTTIFQMMGQSIQPLLNVTTPTASDTVPPAPVKAITHKSGKFIITLPGSFTPTLHDKTNLQAISQNPQAILKLLYLGFGGPKQNLPPALKQFCDTFKKSNPSVTFSPAKPFASTDGSWTGLIQEGKGMLDSKPCIFRVVMLRNLPGHYICIYQMAPASNWAKAKPIFDAAAASITNAQKAGGS